MTETGPRPARGHDRAHRRRRTPAREDLHNKIGAWKAVIDTQTDRILGVGLLGDGSGEVVSAVQMAMARPPLLQRAQQKP